MNRFNRHDRRMLRTRVEAVSIFMALSYGLLLILALARCSGTGAVVEQNVAGTTAPKATAGFIHWIFAADGRTHIGAAFTAEGHDTYNYLLAKFGQDLKPPRPKDFGVTINNGEYDLDEEACVDYGLMATWDRSAEHPAKTLLQKAAAL